MAVAKNSALCHEFGLAGSSIHASVGYVIRLLNVLRLGLPATFAPGESREEPGVDL